MPDLGDVEDAPRGQHPLDDRLRVIEGHIGMCLEELSALMSRQGQLEADMFAMAQQQSGVAQAIREALGRRAERDDEREEDRAVVRSMIWWTVSIALATIVLHVLMASRWAFGPVTLDPRGLFPRPHSSQLPPHAGGKAQ